MQQYVRAVYPVNMRDHRFEMPCRHILKAHIHLGDFVKDLYGPTDSIPHDDLPSLHLQVIAGQVFSAAIRPFLDFRTNQLNLPHVSEIANDLSHAKLHSLCSRTIRRYTNGSPSDPAMVSEQLTHLAPAR